MRLGMTALILAIPLQSFGQDSTNKNGAPWIGVTMNGKPCTGKGQGYGPFDYLQRQQFSAQLNKVETFHFTSDVELLISGVGGRRVENDLDYILRAWPNHHRALAAIIQFKTSGKGKPYSPIECYLQRAIKFSPKDFTPGMLYGVYLHKLGFRGKALKQYQRAEEVSPNNPELHYNLGLLLVSMKKYDEAKNHAIKAYKGGYPFPGLKKKLSKLGYWKNK